MVVPIPVIVALISTGALVIARGGVVAPAFTRSVRVRILLSCRVMVMILAISVGAHHLDEFFGAVPSLRGAVSIHNVLADVILHHLAHESIDGAADGGNDLQIIGAADLRISARSTASTCPRIRRTRCTSLCFSRIVWPIAQNLLVYPPYL